MDDWQRKLEAGSWSEHKPTLEGFKVRLAAGAKGYACSVVDQTDPCQLGEFSNEAGLIYKGEPLQ